MTQRVVINELSHSPASKHKTFCITFLQCCFNVEDVGPTLYKCHTNVLCLLGEDKWRIRWENVTKVGGWKTRNDPEIKISKTENRCSFRLDPPAGITFLPCKMIHFIHVPQASPHQPTHPYVSGGLPADYIVYLATIYKHLSYVWSWSPRCKS